MRKYKPETSWKIEDNLVYNLRQDGWRKGKPIMVNDIAISIEARHLSSEFRADIANTIATALNMKYFLE